MSVQRAIIASFLFVSLPGCHPQANDHIEDSATEPPALTSGTVTSGATPDPSDTDGPTTTTTQGPTSTTAMPSSTASSDSSSSSGDESTATSTGAPLSLCGDGIVEGEEACDDGDDNGDDKACTSSCSIAACGDGMLWTGHEECDNGLKNSNDAACTKDCKNAYCGDNFTQKGVEACDKGMNNNGTVYGGCIPGTCLLGPHCGDTILQPDSEECDDADPDLDETLAKCTGCVWESKALFVSKALLTPDFLGVAAADKLCQGYAMEAGLANSPAFKAWLSDGKKSPSTSFTKSDDLPYTLVTGTKIASGWTDLMDGQLIAPISVDEYGMPILPGEPQVWTSTSIKGALADLGQHCQGWTNNSWEESAQIGSALRADAGWTDLVKKGCHYSAHLYCFEQ